MIRAVTLSDVLAIWGGLTGTVAIALQLVRYFRERSRLRIEFLHGFVQMIAGKGQVGSDTYSRIIVTNLGREPISITGAYFATVKEGKVGLFALADGLLSSPRVLNPENPRTEFMMNESGVDLSAIVYLGINDGFGRTHGKWLVSGRRRREGKRLMRLRPNRDERLT